MISNSVTILALVLVAHAADAQAAAAGRSLLQTEPDLAADDDTVVAAAASPCSWPGHCLGDPCTTFDDCDGDLICISGKCGSSGTVAPPPSTPPPSTSCGWPGHCLGDPCATFNDCDGSLICISGKCGTGGVPPPSSTPPPTGTPGQGRCPSGWFEAALTVYDSWPYPNSNEWQSYSGGKYLGTFAFKPTSSGCTSADEITLTSWSASGKTGKIPSGCHWRHTWVARTRIASVFKSASSPIPISFSSIAGKQIRVASIAAAAANPAGAGVLVNAWDTCADSDCSGCCTANANSPSKVLIDLEKNTLKAVFPSITGFVATDIVYSGSRATYLGSSFDAGSIGGYPGAVCFRLP